MINVDAKRSDEELKRGTVRSRVIFVVFAAVFVVMFQRVYIDDISPLWSYMGLTYSVPSISASLIASLLALVPAAFLPLGLKRPSDFILWLLYICVYIPSSFVPLYVRLRPASDVLTLNLTLLVGLLLIIFILRREARPYNFDLSHGLTFQILLWVIFIVFSIWTYVKFRGSLRLVALSDVYSSGLRLESRAIFATSYVGYAVTMMYGAINPLLIAFGLENRKKLFVLAGIAGQLLCYSTGGAKVIVFSLGVILILHTVVRKHIRKAAHVLMLLSVALLMGTYVAGRWSSGLNLPAVVLGGLVTRAMAIPGDLMAEYQDFFEQNPHLHLAGTKPFSWVLPPPPEGDVIYAITDYYEGDTGATSNASFWAQDGIANFGLPGIIAISILAGAVLRIVDRVSTRHDPCFAAMAFCFAGFNLCNGPLTVALLTGGLMLSMVLVTLAEPQGIGKFRGSRALVSSLRPSRQMTVTG